MRNVSQVGDPVVVPHPVDVVNVSTWPLTIEPQPRDPVVLIHFVINPHVKVPLAVIGPDHLPGGGPEITIHTVGDYPGVGVVVEQFTASFKREGRIRIAHLLLLFSNGVGSDHGDWQVPMVASF